MPSYGGRLAGHAYGGRSLANWSTLLHETRRFRIRQALDALNELFPPCHDDTLMEWVNNGRNLGLLTGEEYVMILAYGRDFNGWWGTRAV
jgi:hypothetical protein